VNIFPIVLESGFLCPSTNLILYSEKPAFRFDRVLNETHSTFGTVLATGEFGPESRAGNPQNRFLDKEGVA
jgi:hypothetical protein